MRQQRVLATMKVKARLHQQDNYSQHTQDYCPLLGTCETTSGILCHVLGCSDYEGLTIWWENIKFISVGNTKSQKLEVEEIARTIATIPIFTLKLSCISFRRCSAGYKLTSYDQEPKKSPARSCKKTVLPLTEYLRHFSALFSLEVFVWQLLLSSRRSCLPALTVPGTGSLVLASSLLILLYS